MFRQALVMLVAGGALVAGCGDDSTGNGGASASAEKAANEKKETAMKGVDAKKGDGGVAPGKGATVKVVGSQFGRILADSRGQAVYLFDKEKTRRSECYGACAKAWPPVLTEGKPRAGTGARRRLIGATRRRNGKVQVTFRGRPLYYYEEDSPGRILCQDVDEFGGRWQVVRPNGRPVS